MKTLIFLKSLIGKPKPLKELIFILNEVLKNFIYWLMATLNKKVYLSSLGIITNYSCNLKCKYCSNLIPYLPKEQKKAFPFEVLKKDIDILLSFIYPRKIVLQGGEALLNKDLNKIIVYLGTRFKGRIHLSINATILLNEELLSLCKTYDVKIRLSDYGVEKQQISTILKLCEISGVRCNIRLTEFRNPELESWYDMGINIRRNDNDTLVQKIYDNCIFKHCYSVCNGLLSKCPRSPMGHLCGFYPYFSEDLIDIRHDTDLKGRLTKLKKEKFMEGCRYCLGMEGRRIFPGEQLTNR